jgi:hypothetical protein
MIFAHIPEERRILGKLRSLAQTEHMLEAAEFGHLQKVRSEVFAPKGAGGLSPGFQPWEPTTQSDAP